MRRLACSLVLLLWLAACTGGAAPGGQTVYIHYQHVANVHQIHFGAPLAPPARPASWVRPRDADGFWAVFVICALDVSGRGLPGFVYDVNNFRVAYGAHDYVPLPPYGLRYEASQALNRPAEQAVLASAIAGELQEGPAVQVFAPGFHGALHYRFAVLLPRGLPDYAGEALALRYVGQRAVALANGYPPSDIAAAGGNATGVAARCLP